MGRSRIGIWFIGARGSVATASAVGLAALQRQRIGNAGLVSELPNFTHLPLPAWSDFVVGGHDIRDTTLLATAEGLVRDNRAIDPDILAAVRKDLVRFDKNVRPGTLVNVGDRIRELAETKLKRRHETPRQAVERIQSDISDFRRRYKLEQLVVVNLASTEPTVDERHLPRRWVDLEKQLDDAKQCKLGASSLYAIAALDAGHPFVDFTPSLCAKPKAICELAELRDTCHAGHDGKTGETLLKSVLGPMFAMRNLEVLSWVGHNIFGNLDGKVLDDPANKQTKVTSKDQLLSEILGYQPQTLVSIEFIESLGDWKTAWDHIHFRGFLGTPMKMQFTWQGCDSLLAAPLVLDLIRFTYCAYQQGDRGVLKFLASFFKSPHKVKTNDFGRQFQMLLDWARSVEKAST